MYSRQPDLWKGIVFPITKPKNILGGNDKTAKRQQPTQKGQGIFTRYNLLYYQECLERLEEGFPYEAGVLLAEGVPEIITHSLEWLEVQGNVEWLAYVIMPDHLHLLFKLKEQEPLSKIMHKFSHFTSRQINLRQKRQGSIWQEGYYDRAIRDEEELQRAFAYIHTNLVKAGYVGDINDWV